MSTQPSQETRRSKTGPSWLQRVAASLGFSSTATVRETLERAIAEAEADSAEPLPAQERTMLLNILGFGSLRVSEVMAPRADIVAIGEDQSLAALLKLFSSTTHSRLPVYRGSLDNPVGMVHIKDVLPWATAEASRQRAADKPGGEEQPLELDFSLLDLSQTIAASGLVREVLFVPPSMPAMDLLAKMRARQIHLALVVDEYGGTDGLASIEDLVEEIVGDIADEHDTDEQLSIGVEGGAFIASAKTPIEDVEQALGLSLTSPGATHEVDTLGGLILAMVGRVPKRGHHVVHPAGVTFEILEAGPRRIHKVRIRKQLSLPSPDAGEGPALQLPPPDAHDGPRGAKARGAGVPNARAA